MRTLISILVFALVTISCDRPHPSPTRQSLAVSTATPPRIAATRQRVSAQPPVFVDPRTPDQIAQAACASPGGEWRCTKLARHALLAATGSSPIIPSSWTVGGWYIDPANASGCASDSNSGTSSTCSSGGIGPLTTWGELQVHRWGCQGGGQVCPRLQQTTTITWLSSSSGNADPVYVNLASEKGGTVTLAGQLGTAQQVCSGTLSGVVAKNRSTAQLLNATLCASLSPGLLVVNSTHSSSAWTYKLVSGTTWAMTQPLDRTLFTEVDTWANGDSYTVYRPVSVNIVQLSDLLEENNASFNNALHVNDLTILDPQGTGNDNLDIAPHPRVWMAEVSIQRTLELGGLYATGITPAAFRNTDFAGGVAGGVVTPIEPSFEAVGGDLRTFFNPVGPIDWSYDFIVGTSGNVYGGGSIEQIFIDSGVTLRIDGTVQMHGDAGLTSTFIWGPGTFNYQGSGHLTYPSGGGAAAAAFLVTTLQLNGQTLGCVAKPSSSTITCNTTVSAASLDANLGATSGCIGVIGGASLCNF